MSGVSDLLSRIPSTWQALLVLGAVAMGGYSAHGLASQQGALPVRVSQLEVEMRALRDERLPPRVQILESDMVVLKDRQRFNICVSLTVIEGQNPRPCRNWLSNPNEYLPPR